MLRRAALPLVILALSVSTFAILNARDQRIQQGLTPAIADLAAVRAAEITDSAGIVLLRGVFATTAEATDETERSAELRRPSETVVRGEAEIEIARSKGIVTKDEIEVTADGLPPSASCKLVVDGVQVSEFTTTSKGHVDLKLSRRR